MTGHAHDDRGLEPPDRRALPRALAGAGRRLVPSLCAVVLATCSPLWASPAPPEPIVDGLRLLWEPVDAVSINVHTGRGAYLESLPGDASEWLAPAVGEYYLVAADRGDWRDWARSITVTAGAGADPTRVRNLRASVYDTHSAEIFWEPPLPGGLFAVENRVYRDGVLVKTCDCRSHYDVDLTIGTEYRYTVVPVNASGVAGSESDIVVVIPAPGSIGPPRNLRGSVYSASALELFWERDPRLRRYEIYRDGAFVASTDGVSFFDHGLEAGRLYRYTVKSFDARDIEGGTGDIALRTGQGGSAAPPDDVPPTDSDLGVSSHEQVVRDVLRVYTGSPLRETILLGWRFLTEVPPDGRTEHGSPFAYTEDYVCRYSGTVTAVSEQAGPRSQRLVADFDRCLSDVPGRRELHELDGRMTLVSADGKRYAEGGTFAFEDFSVSDGGHAAVTRFHGTVVYTVERSPGGGDTRTWQNRLERLFADAHGVDPLRLRDLDTTFFTCERCLGGPPYVGLSGSLWMSSPRYGTSLTVSTPVAFVNESSTSTAFPSGRFDIRAEDGSRVLLDADNGSDADVTVLITDRHGDTDGELLVPWSRWADSLRF